MRPNWMTHSLTVCFLTFLSLFQPHSAAEAREAERTPTLSRGTQETLERLGYAHAPAPVYRVGQHKVAFNEAVEYLTTGDGVKLAIHRVAAPTVLYPTPILLFHGICSNYATWDLNEVQSVQRYLAGLGFDTWAIDWRGAGLSERPAKGRYFNWRYSIDDLIHYDAVAALNHVLSRTGKARVIIAGHSMGGLITHALLGSEPVSDKVAGIVTLSGATLMGTDGSSENPPTQALMSLIGLVSPFVVDDAVVPAEEITRLAMSGYSRLLERLVRWAGVWLWNPRNVNVELIEQMATKAVGNTNTTILQQFTIFAHKYDTTSFAGWTGMADASDYFLENGFVSYVERLSSIKVPALVISGAADKIVGAHNVQQVYSKLGSSDKTYVELGTDAGFSFDYGHVDMVMGIKAPEEVYPVLGAWMKSRSK